jgi:hypothetical protein
VLVVTEKATDRITTYEVGRGSGYYLVLGLGLAAPVLVTIWVSRIVQRAPDQEIPDESSANA